MYRHKQHGYGRRSVWNDVLNSGAGPGPTSMALSHNPSEPPPHPSMRPRIRVKIRRIFNKWRARSGRTHTPRFHRRAKTIENISRIRMVVARASGTLIASSLKQNTFLTLKLCPAGPPTDGHPRVGRVGECQEVPWGADEASPMGGAGPYSGVPSMH